MNWNNRASAWKFWRQRSASTNTLLPLPRGDGMQPEQLIETSSRPAAPSVSTPDGGSRHYKPFVLSYIGLSL